MREILFKAKRVDNGEWVEGDLCRTPEDGCCIVVASTYEEPEHGYKEHVTQHITVDPATVCQYTGLLDKNGKMIFEGDILRRERFSDWVVVYDDGAFKVYNDCNPSMFFYSENFDFDAREIIGNIHDKEEGE